ncbi:Vacuolar protein sorting-associated protein 35 containing protein [Trichomonas vaginalis G3]|uniref:Vacuolar protein sorting-associated protein 35 n=1 Tax=Trichomonas vaginalis (strain ATCC PRA-98 / G3) TaxID=412133 RepID=A2FE95_TRIV3|nr:vacuolar protein sorting-associated protein 35 family [Trichomonas vaginalis G3]EAX96786.1 Vacuolar protein sorting-associated protein 35 containing protein [Trichomonas vaginalis G3]KAI5552828.1 vacuolar protein sorting-associated protein 35 family [Trichomonas vaginalis G3]|eukprot:XP_001309716.1 Vacuolar protein sorting-associated protein 35 containing protein [Trichomonas vaginalis G3]
MSKEAEAPAPELKYGQLPSEEIQQKVVREVLEKVNGLAYLMRRNFDNNKIDDALKYATLMLEEMKINTLSPIHYNELYQVVLSELTILKDYFNDSNFFTDRRIAELYEILQYTPSIVARLYLLFTIAPAFVKRGHAKANDIMRDLIEMARGVQHPTRALFLRHFMLHILKEILPDGQREGGTIEDTLHFILENFKQMNVLWVRLEFSLDTKTIEERKLQRSQLKQLVGHNIQRISDLRGLDVAHYKEIVLPCIVEQTKACGEPLAQYYIIESITQVFPVEFHIETLDILFNLLQHLDDDVNTLALVTNIIQRLQTFCRSDSNAINTVRLVAVQIYSLLHADQKFALEDTLDMLGTLLNFTLEADASNFDNVNAIFKLVEGHIEDIAGESRLDSVSVSRKLCFFLVTPLREMKDASMIFDLEYFPILVNRLRFLDRKAIALEVCKGFARTEAYITDVDNMKAFFNIEQVLLKRADDYEKDPDGEPLSVALSNVGRVFHLIRDRKDLDNTFSLLTSISAALQTFDPEVKEALYLPFGEDLLRVAVEINQTQGCQTTVRGVLQQVYILLTQNDPPAIPSFWLFVEAALISDRYGTEGITTEFFTNALRIWKEGMIDSNIRFRMLLSMIRTATQLLNVTPNTYSSITSELCSCAGGLLAKEQQAEAHLLCAHMFNVDRKGAGNEDDNEEEEDDGSAFMNPMKVKNCLVRALKAASQMMDKKDMLPWFYKVLAEAIYFIEKGVDIPIDWFNALTNQIDQEHQNLGSDLENKLTEQAKKFYINTVAHKNKVIQTK